MTLSVTSVAFASRPPACTRVQSAIDAYAKKLPPDRELRRISPYLSAAAVPSLMAQTRSVSDARAFEVYAALGASRHALALKLLLDQDPPELPLSRVGRSVALLGLGSGVETGTIAAAMKKGDPAQRRQVARALSRMRQRRPQNILRAGMTDPAPAVRVQAAASLLEHGSSRARRVLLSLARFGPPAQRKMAAAALADSGVRVRVDYLDQFAEPMRSRLTVSEAAHGQRKILRRLSGWLNSRDPDRRAAAFAAVALVESTGRLRRMAAKPVRNYGRDAEAERAMALALQDDREGYDVLSTLSKAEVSRAVAVLWAFSGASKKARLPVAHATRLADLAMTWLETGRLSGRTASWVLRAFEVIEPDAARIVARARINGPDGWGLRTSLRVIGRLGDADDLAAVVAVTDRVKADRTQVEAWRAAHMICDR